MITIKKDDYIFSVDIEKTKKYYRTHSLCECVCCRNYYTQIKERLPKLTAFLNDFGVDISKPDEICSVEMENSIDYLSVDYTVCGNIVKPSEYEIDIYDDLFLSIVVTDRFVSPNEQTGPYFTFSVMPINLPWVLDEPFPILIKEKMANKSGNFLSKLFKKYNSKIKDKE